MFRFPRAILAYAVVIALAVASTARAQSTTEPLALADAVRIAIEGRAEVDAARARARAGESRPAIVGALEEPMFSPALDHLPFMLGGADVSFTVEQRFPLSPIRRNRRDSALAELERLRAVIDTASLDVGLEAATAFLMLHERRRMAQLLDEQLAFARDVVTAADARYASGYGSQADVLRAEVEVSRLEAQARGLAGQVRAAEAMLNTSLGRNADIPVPLLLPSTVEQPLPSWAALKAQLSTRPELAAARADITRAQADVRAMRDMAKPMLTVRTGPAYTMTEGRGWMAMVGISLPIWKSKNQALVAEAEAMQQMSEAELAAMTRMIEGQAALALSELRAAGEQQAAIRDSVIPRARMVLDPALAGYATGRLPLVSVIEAIQVLWSVQAELVEADVRVGLAWTRLGRAIGTYEVLHP